MRPGTEAPLLEVRGLAKRYAARSGGLLSARASDGRGFAAVDDVSFRLDAGEVLGIVGHSGCGKTTLARCVMRLIEPTEGSVRYNGEEILSMERDRLRSVVRTGMRMVFQHPDAVLNPGCTIGRAIALPMRVHETVPPGEIPHRVTALLREVGLDAGFADKYPSELSGGEKRRVGLCRALATNPDLIIADEPLTGLDVLLQEQILALLTREQAARGFGLVVVSHDLERVNQICDRVLVMYRGRVVEDLPIRRELGLAREQFSHPYSIFLQESRLGLGESARPRGGSQSVSDALADTESASGPFGEGGCAYRESCGRWARMGNDPTCARTRPAPQLLSEHHRVACHFAEMCEPPTYSHRAL